MKNIINYAIKNGEINKDMLIAMVNQMDDEMAIRFTEAILGITAPNNKIPMHAKIYDYDNCVFLSYNYLNDRVEYQFDNEVTRYFKTKQDAEEFNDGASYSWSGVRQRSEEYQYEGRRVFVERGTCSLACWLEGAK